MYIAAREVLCRHLSSLPSHNLSADVLNCPRPPVYQLSQPAAAVGHYVMRPQLTGLHSVVAPVRSTTGEWYMSGIWAAVYLWCDMNDLS